MPVFPARGLHFMQTFCNLVPMFIKQRRKIGFFLARMRFRRQPAESVGFSRAFSDATTALVIVPTEQSERALAIPFLRSLQQKFKGSKLTVVSLETTRDLSVALGPCSVFPLHREQLTMFQLPRKAGMEQLLRHRYDIALDLNTTFDLPAAYVCRSVSAAFRIGFAKEHGDSFYNFLFRTSPQRNLQTRYAQLLHMLAMF
jgi:ADP-heptose:LPS heptosyltransferase